MTATTLTCSALQPLVDALVALPVDDLGVEALQEQIIAVTPQVSRLQGWLQATAGQLAHLTGGRMPAADEGGRARSVAGWLADVQHGTSGAAGSQLRTARLLRSLPLVTAAVLDGVLTPAQAAVLTRLVDTIERDALLESQPHLIAVAAAMDPAQLGVWVAHQIATHCEPAFDEQRARARDRRFLTSRREADGSLRGTFLLPAEDGEVFLTVLEPLARRNLVQDDRTAGQRRADALVDVCEQVLRHGTLPDAGGLRPQLSYVLPAEWAAAQHARAACPSCGPRCGDHQPLTFADTVTTALPGHGGIRAEQACATAAWSGPQTRSRIETLLCDARISRVLLTRFGQVQGLEPLRDSITPAQRRTLAARDLGCTARGCTRPPAMCDAHHLTRRSDDARQPGPALPQTPRPVAPRQAPPAPPERPLAPGTTDSSITRRLRRPVPSRTLTVSVRRPHTPGGRRRGPPAGAAADRLRDLPVRARVAAGAAARAPAAA